MDWIPPKPPSSRSWGSPDSWEGDLGACFAYGTWRRWADTGSIDLLGCLREPVIEDAIYEGGRGADLLSAWSSATARPLQDFLPEGADGLAAFTAAINAARPGCRHLARLVCGECQGTGPCGGPRSAFRAKWQSCGAFGDWLGCGCLDCGRHRRCSGRAFGDRLGSGCLDCRRCRREGS